MSEITTPIIAYKFVVFGGKHFHSPQASFEWLPGWNVISNGPLDENSRNGFYSLKKCPDADWIYPVVVELEIAGKIIVCENGYRSEFARISKVVSCPNDGMPYWMIGREYEENHSTERVRSAWPKKTPYTKVYQLPPESPYAEFKIPIMAAPPLARLDMDGTGGLLIPYSVLTITLDTAHSDGRHYYQYGYNAKHDILVYREVED